MSWLSRNLQVFGLSSLLVAITAPLVYGFYHQLYRKGLQAEARLIFSYVHTLQKVYKMEQGAYANFPAYGAPEKGLDQCAQPLGAAQLGFLLYGCHDSDSTPPRYAYQSLEASGNSYQLEALGGSDAEGRSLVCFIPSSREELVSTQNSEIKVRVSCW